MLNQSDLLLKTWLLWAAPLSIDHPPHLRVVEGSLIEACLDADWDDIIFLLDWALGVASVYFVCQHFHSFVVLVCYFFWYVVYSGAECQVLNVGLQTAALVLTVVQWDYRFMAHRTPHNTLIAVAPLWKGLVLLQHGRSLGMLTFKGPDYYLQLPRSSPPQ